VTYLEGAHQAWPLIPTPLATRTGCWLVSSHLDLRPIDVETPALAWFRRGGGVLGIDRLQPARLWHRAQEWVEASLLYQGDGVLERA